MDIEQPNLPANAGDKEPTRLTELQQSIADLLIEDSKLSPNEIAEKLSCDKSGVYKTLRKQHVREYIMQHVDAELLAAGIEAMSTQRKLLSAKSEYIRHQAASDILNRNDVGTGGVILGQAVQVKIDLT